MDNILDIEYDDISSDNEDEQQSISDVETNTKSRKITKKQRRVKSHKQQLFKFDLYEDIFNNLYSNYQGSNVLNIHHIYKQDMCDIFVNMCLFHTT